MLAIVAGAVHFTGIYDLKKLGPELKKLFNKTPPAAPPPATTPPPANTPPPAEEEEEEGGAEDEEEEDEDNADRVRSYYLIKTPEFSTYDRIPAGWFNYS